MSKRYEFSIGEVNHEALAKIAARKGIPVSILIIRVLEAYIKESQEPES